MPETATTRKTKAAPVELRGKRVLVWDPENDYRQGNQAPLRGYESVRKYVFCYVDAAKSDLKKDTNQPSFKYFILEPGLNWIDAREWAEVQRVSAERFKAESEQNNPHAVDEIAQLVASQGIFVFQPSDAVVESGQFTGNFEDYPASEMRRLMGQVDDEAALQQYARDTQDYNLRGIINDRLDSLRTGY